MGPHTGGGSEPRSLWAAQGAAGLSLPKRRLETRHHAQPRGPGTRESRGTGPACGGGLSLPPRWGGSPVTLHPEPVSCPRVRRASSSAFSESKLGQEGEAPRSNTLRVHSTESSP